MAHTDLVTTQEWLPIATLVLGAVLTFLVTWINGAIAHRRDLARDAHAAEVRRGTASREHAANALSLIRNAEAESWKRSPEKGSFDIDLDDLKLERAEAEIDLITDSALREQLAGVLGAVNYPFTLCNSSYSPGVPANLQRRGLRLLREALAAYVREESDADKSGGLAQLAADNRAAHEERAEWDESHAS